MALFEVLIDIETAAGVKVGAGPITSATQWQHTPRLDGAGEFRFTLPASDIKSAALANKRIARCYTIINGARAELGAGIIDKIQTAVGDATMLEVSGPDIMGELAYRTVGNLVVCEQGWIDLSEPTTAMLGWFRVAEDSSSDPNITISQAHDGNDATYETIYLMSDKVGYPEHAAYLYVGSDARFDRIRILFAGGDYADNNQVLYAQYYNGSGWVTLTITTDGTAVGGYTFKQNGDIIFPRPTDWTRYTAAHGGGNWFWVRLRVARTWPDDPSWTDYFKLAEVDIYADIPTQNGVNLIMAYAPDTWTKTGYPDTVSDKYLEFNGESVLEALLTLAEQGGIDGTTAIREHFRYDPASPREVDWLGTTVTSSGVRAISPEYALAAEGKAELAIIQTLTEQVDTTEVATRVYPHSADGLTLALSTRTAPTGYTHDLTNNYIQHTAGAATYGQIERWIDFTEISMQQADSYTTHPEMVANQLHDRAVEWLRTHATASSFYQLSIVQWYGLIMAGDTIDVVYHEWPVDPVTGAVHTVDIDTIADGTPLHVIAPTILVDAQGVGIIGLEVATIDREAKTDAGVVVDLVRQGRRTTGSSYTLTNGAMVAALPANQRVYTYAETVGDVTNTAYTVTHNLNVADVVVQVYGTLTSTKQKLDPDIYQTGVNAVRIVTGTAPGTNAWRVRVIGFNRGGDEDIDGGGGATETYYIYRGGANGVFGDDNIHKLTLDGVTVWSTQASSTSDGEYQENIQGIATDTSGNVYVAGDSWFHYVGSTATNVNVEKIDAAGTFQWRASVVQGASARAVAAMPNGNVAIMHAGAAMTGGTAALTVLDGADGSRLWRKIVTPGPTQTVAVDNDSNVYVAGTELAGVSIWAYSASGTALWTAAHGDDVHAIAVDPAGYLYVAGHAVATKNVRRVLLSSGVEDTAGSWPVYIDQAVAAGVVVDAEHNVYIYGYGATQTAAHVYAYNSMGSALWTDAYESERDARSMTLSTDDRLYVAGDHGASYMTVRVYDAVTGTEGTGAYPLVFGTQDTYAVAAMPGPVGAFPIKWGL